ncbi:MAG: hypothetical protein ABJO09_13955 [Hyphomicrobiales bacterium]
MNLTKMRAQMLEFDGRATTVLTEIEARYGENSDYVDTLIVLIGDVDTNLSDGSTWLIKAWLVKNKELSANQTGKLVDALPEISSWQAQLHICQSVRHLSIKSAQSLILVQWLLDFNEHCRPFLRAWSVDAIVAVAQMHNQHAELARKVLDNALEDNASSVRARARSLSQAFDLQC